MNSSFNICFKGAISQAGFPGPCRTKINLGSVPAVCSHCTLDVAPESASVTYGHYSTISQLGCDATQKGPVWPGSPQLAWYQKPARCATPPRTGVALRSLIPVLPLTHQVTPAEASSPWGPLGDHNLCPASVASGTLASPCRHRVERPFRSAEFPAHGNLAGAARLWSPSFIIHLFPCKTTAAALEGHGPGTDSPPASEHRFNPATANLV